jgi:hypothetical protein
MKYFYDTEFHEDGVTIDLLSIGIVCEDGRTFYAVNEDADWDRANANLWLRDNVSELLSAADGTVELWADYAAYDHVVLAQLFGTMMNLPAHIPMWTHDFQQELERLDIDPVALPDSSGVLHNALGDALKLREQWLHVQCLAVGAL